MWITRHDSSSEESKTGPAWLIHSVPHAFAAGLPRTACSLGLQSLFGQAATRNPCKHCKKTKNKNRLLQPLQASAEAHCAPRHDPHSTHSRRVVIRDGGRSFLGLVAAQMGRCDQQTGSRNPNEYFWSNKEIKMHHAPAASLSGGEKKKGTKMVPSKMPAVPPSRAHQHAAFSPKTAAQHGRGTMVAG